MQINCARDSNPGPFPWNITESELTSLVTPFAVTLHHQHSDASLEIEIVLYRELGAGIQGRAVALLPNSACFGQPLGADCCLT